MQKMYFVTHEALRQGKQFYRVELDFSNTFNARLQAARWREMNMFHIPDIDLVEQIYDSATVRLAPNDAESATITFASTTSRSLLRPQMECKLCLTRCRSSKHGVAWRSLRNFFLLAIDKDQN